MNGPEDGGAAPAALAICAGDGRIWGMTGAERLARIFRRANLAAPNDASTTVVLARADWVYDESVIRALAKRPGAVLVGPDRQPLAAHVPAAEAVMVTAAIEAGTRDLPGLERLTLDDLAYNEELRKREPPVLEPLNAANVRAVEARLFKGSYKGVTDMVTKYLWPTPARIVTRWCALAGITPNQVTLAGLVLTLAAFGLFWTGHFGWGLVCAWIMTFLDTVDGKLARVTLTSSQVGNVLDHGIDLIHPPFWWWAWQVGVQQHSGFVLPYADWILAVNVAGYIAQRIEEGVFIKLWGFHMHAWRPFDSWFRLITARRNPHLLILTPATLLGRPDIGILLVAAWTAASFFVHLAQIVQAAMTPRARVVSWLAR